jgi:hypothetical protein
MINTAQSAKPSKPIVRVGTREDASLLAEFGAGTFRESCEAELGAHVIEARTNCDLPLGQPPQELGPVYRVSCCQPLL